jgi:hypothetical protein
MSFEDRKKELGEKIVKLIKEYEVDLFAANSVTKDGDVYPCIKMIDVAGKALLTNENVNDNQPKEITAGDKEE